MKIVVLSSGSKGNTTYIESGNTRILIDAGNTCKYIINSLNDIGVNPNTINAILITHTHIDHVGGLKTLLKQINPNIYLTCKMLKDLDYIKKYTIIDNNDITIGDFNIQTIKTSHDSNDSLGYIINDSIHSLVFVTDTGYINKKYFDKLKNKDIYIMESNHDIEMLSNSSYPFVTRQRIMSDKGHLSNVDCSKYLANFVGNNTKYIVLIHLSHENNTCELAYNTLNERLIKDNININKIIISKQNEKTELLEV